MWLLRLLFALFLAAAGPLAAAYPSPSQPGSSLQAWAEATGAVPTPTPNASYPIHIDHSGLIHPGPGPVAVVRRRQAPDQDDQQHIGSEPAAAVGRRQAPDQDALRHTGSEPTATVGRRQAPDQDALRYTGPEPTAAVRRRRAPDQDVPQHAGPEPTAAVGRRQAPDQDAQQYNGPEPTAAVGRRQAPDQDALQYTGPEPTAAVGRRQAPDQDALRYTGPELTAAVRRRQAPDQDVPQHAGPEPTAAVGRRQAPDQDAPQHEDDDQHHLEKRGGRVTWILVNKAGRAIRTVHGQNPGSPVATAVSGRKLGSGTIGAGARATFVTPPGWAGRVAVGDAEYPASGSMSLLEGSFQNQGSGYVLAVDVSYVDAFTKAITCACNASGKVLSGCSVDLWKRNTCPNKEGGSCLNPLRPIDHDGLHATPFFQPCEGAAFTWPRDNAMSNGECHSNSVTCCIGTAAQGCPIHPKQKGT